MENILFLEYRCYSPLVMFFAAMKKKLLAAIKLHQEIVLLHPKLLTALKGTRE